MYLPSAGDFSFGQGKSGGSGFRVTFQNLDLLNRKVAELENGLRVQANKEMRDAAQNIARSLIPSIQAMAAMSPNPIAPALAATARAKRDRMVMVQIGGVNPKLSGFKRGVGIKRMSPTTRSRLKGGRDATSRNYRTTLAWASEMGPYPGSAFNRFRVPRRESGYYVQPAINASMDRAIKEYSDAIERIILGRSDYR